MKGTWKPADSYFLIFEKDKFRLEKVKNSFIAQGKIGTKRSLSALPGASRGRQLEIFFSFFFK